MSVDADRSALLGRFAPGLFVLLWSSGFIVARSIRPFTEPESFVSLRFALSALVLTAIAWAGRARWPRTPTAWLNGLGVGALMQGAYTGGVFWAVKHGLPAAVAALITGLQPLLTGMIAGPLLGERVSARRWLGIVVGFAGAVLVLAPDLHGSTPVPILSVVMCMIATGGITLGTVWQKRTGGNIDLRSGAAIQLVGATAVTLPFAVGLETHPFVSAPTLWFGLAWAVLVLSVGATLLLLHLIKDQAVARVTSLFYLVPPITALMAFGLFGVALVPIQAAGMAVAGIGVAVANHR